MPTPTFNEQMVTKLEALLLANPGATEIACDGGVTKYADLVARLQQYRTLVARDNGSRPRFAAVDLGGFK